MRPGKLKALLIYKYFFQLFIVPIVFDIIIFILIISFQGYQKFCNDIMQVTDILGVPVHSLTIGILFGFLINLVNILSIIPFIKLIADCFTKDDIKEKIIDFNNFFPIYELQCIRQSKRFMCDTFSKKENIEIFIIDENKKKYRLFWNESYGDIGEYKKVEKAQRIKMKYLKHSRIIVDCEAII